LGYWGDLVLLRSDRPLAELPPFLDRPGCSDEHDDCLTLCEARPGGWQTVQVCHYLPGADYQWWLRGLVAASGAPVMILTVADSGVGLLRALAPAGAGLETFLDPNSDGLPEFLDYYRTEDDGDGDDGDGEGGHDAVQRLLDEVPATADSLASWAAEAGFHADTAAIRRTLVKEADPFVENNFIQLINDCGLPAPFPSP
jgi:hypothetical protein